MMSNKKPLSLKKKVTKIQCPPLGDRGFMKTEAYIQSLQSLPFTGNRRIIIAGGGTGGHIFPAIAIANAIKEQQPDTEILFVGATGKMEMQKVPEAGYKIIGLYIAGYNRSSLLKNITLPFKLVKSFLQVTKILRTFKPACSNWCRRIFQLSCFKAGPNPWHSNIYT